MPGSPASYRRRSWSSWRVLLIIAALRLLGGVFGILITILLALLVLHLLMPGLQVPTNIHV